MKNLHDALNTKYDEFYELEQEKVEFSKCEKGYIIKSEGPQTAKSFGHMEPRGGKLWSELV